jgi:hypothetical protein
MKKVIVAALIVAILIFSIPVPAAGNSTFRVSSQTSIKDPLEINLSPDTPIIPDGIWPGDTLEWRFKVTNVSPRNYWVIGFIDWAAESDLWTEDIGVKVGEKNFDLHEPIIVEKGTYKVISVYITISEISPPCPMVKFVPCIQVTNSPE